MPLKEYMVEDATDERSKLQKEMSKIRKNDPDSFKIFMRKAGVHKHRNNKRRKDKERKEIEREIAEY
jgi:hypothetical protein